MIFEAKGKRYRMSFAHQVYQTKKEMPIVNNRPIRGETKCFLFEMLPIGKAKEPIKLAEGVAHCSALDVYSKEAGRRLALRRALEQIWPDQHQLWGIAFQAYSNRKAKAA